MRLFIATPFHSQTLENLKKTLTLKGLKPVNDSHLTFAFLGETPEHTIPTLTHHLENVHHPPFTVHLDKLGAFPNTDKPRILWIGLQPEQPLLHLHQTITTTLHHHPNKPFTPHLTLARVKGPYNKHQLTHALKTNVPPETFPITHFILYESTLTPLGPTYQEIHTFPLKP